MGEAAKDNGTVIKVELDDKEGGGEHVAAVADKGREGKGEEIGGEGATLADTEEDVDDEVGKGVAA